MRKTSYYKLEQHCSCILKVLLPIVYWILLLETYSYIIFLCTIQDVQFLFSFFHYFSSGLLPKRKGSFYIHIDFTMNPQGHVELTKQGHLIQCVIVNGVIRGVNLKDTEIIISRLLIMFWRWTGRLILTD